MSSKHEETKEGVGPQLLASWTNQPSPRILGRATPDRLRVDGAKDVQSNLMDRRALSAEHWDGAGTMARAGV